MLSAPGSEAAGAARKGCSSKRRLTPARVRSSLDPVMESRVVAICPNCDARYKVARERVPARGARLRCARCEHVFRLEMPEARDRQGIDADAPRVLVVESDASLAKRVAEFLGDWGLRAEVVAEGEAALLALFREPPRLAVIGVCAPGLSAAALLEVLRLASDLRGVEVVRVAPAEQVGASAAGEFSHVLEPPDLPEGLSSILKSLELGREPDTPETSSATEPSCTLPVAPPLSVADPTAADPKPERSEPDPEVVAAERLARIVVSDILLYNENRVELACKSDDPADVLKAELAEGRALFESRGSRAVREDRDFLAQELERQIARRRTQAGSKD